MANPTNNFTNFFDSNDPHPMMAQFKPSLKMVVRTLIEIVSKNPLFYKNDKERLIVSAAMLYATDELTLCKERGEKPKDIETADAAFMMLLGDIMSMTYDEFAGDLERQHFPHNRKDYEQDIQDELDGQDDF